MAEEWILENAHLRMCVSSLGGKVQKFILAAISSAGAI